MLQEIMMNPFGFWSVAAGLFFISCVTISSGFFLLGASLGFLKRIVLRGTFRKIAKLLIRVALVNKEVNPELSALAKLLLQSLDPASKVFEGEMAEVRLLLNVPTDEDLLNKEAADKE